MAYIDPTVADFKLYFARDFPYGTTPDTVNDADIQKAIDMTTVTINQCIMPNQTFYSIAFELLTANNLVLNLRASMGGLAAQYDWLISSKSVGSVSEGLSIPPDILNNASYAMLTKTPYGAAYLEMILPFLHGLVVAVHGRTLP